MCIQHAEHGDLLHAALRVLDTRTGEVVGELEDKGRNLDPVAWSPVHGDQRLAFTSELGAFERPAIWDVRSGERRDLDIDLPGGVFPVRWWPDAATLLGRHEHEGRAQLVRIDLATGATAALTGLDGDIDGAGIRPDGSVWYRVSDAVRPPRIMQAGGGEVVASPDAPPPAGRPYASRFATNAHGDRIQMFVVTPDGPGPFPTVCNIHGGPEWHERDRFDAETQAFVDRGYAVAIVNYRGSTGYGIAFREALVHNVCFTETEDILACVDALVADGITDPDRVFWSGWSWGGCLACFNAGTHPDRWRAIFAGIPAGDFVAAHHASAPELQAWDEAVYGGTPEQVPDRVRAERPDDLRRRGARARAGDRGRGRPSMPDRRCDTVGRRVASAQPHGRGRPVPGGPPHELDARAGRAHATGARLLRPLPLSLRRRCCAPAPRGTR